eukprot:c29261_g1_i2 orf=1348-4578(+)
MMESTEAIGAKTTMTLPKICLNMKCGTTTSPNWKPGWLMRSGRIADLCESCGLAYEQLRFCETFHSADAGWRTCNSCKKRLHCGCIASIYSFILLDAGGVECTTCAKRSIASNVESTLVPQPECLVKNLNPVIKGCHESFGAMLSWNTESGPWSSFPFPWIPSASQTGVPLWRHIPEPDRTDINHVAEDSTGDMTSAVDSSKADDDSNEKDTNGSNKAETSVSAQPSSLDLSNGETCGEEGTKPNVVENDIKELMDSVPPKENAFQGCFVPENGDAGAVLGLEFGTDPRHTLGKVRELDQPSMLSVDKATAPGINLLEASASACLNMPLSMYPLKDATEEGEEHAVNTVTSSLSPSGESKENSKLSGLSSIRHRQRQLLPKPPQSQQSSRTETSKEPYTQAAIRVARPPGEGRGRNQLLPRYWPRITDQELQQITSGDSNCTIVPLFEKMLSASDAGRIGRLVLPKACAEAYFPPISQPEGLPLKIQDVSGKDWTFQFRFWPNNNSRMYVLEGVTPCIQSMNLQAGDTVTFSRLDPDGKLVMGYRRAPNSLSAQDTQQCAGSTATVPLGSGSFDDISAIANLTSLLPHTAKGTTEMQGNGQYNVSDTGYGWYKTEIAGAKAKESLFLQSIMVADRRKGRHLGSKSKRLRLEVEDSIELKLSWEEAQELLRPPPNVAPSIVTVEGHEFEEYEEPPVFGKRTIFTTRQNGQGEDQWAQCDDCGSWRKVPCEEFLPTRWTCSNNVWDSERAACTAPQDVKSEEINKLLQHAKQVRKSDNIKGPKVTTASSGLDALATAATLGENTTASSSSPAPTTKHPRHRPGCTCIVCIQPPSGKGPKHKPTCLCNVCMTVKRRFKTLMLRRKKRQSERDAENARKKRSWVKEEEVNSGTILQTEISAFPENGSKQGSVSVALLGSIPRINNLSSNGSRYSPKATQDSCFASRARPVGEEHLASKGHIDLNSQPDREEENGKDTGRVSMVRLVQSATDPLERYLKHQGIPSLMCHQQIVPPMNFVRNVGGRKVDDLIGNQSAVLNQDRPQEPPLFMLGQDKGDAVTSAQSSDIMEQKSVLQVLTQVS